LSIWYKLTDRTLTGAVVSLFGAFLTVLLNVWWIPAYGYKGSAWATLICYASMAILSYWLGRKYYPVAYNVKRVLGYISLGVGLYYLQQQLMSNYHKNLWLLSSELILLYTLLAVLIEKRHQR
jgi:peptidoglycan biosynthesis protein MviN/MurJ (putative lipid II flippase)